jgi:hypothetical protein
MGKDYEHAGWDWMGSGGYRKAFRQYDAGRRVETENYDDNGLDRRGLECRSASHFLVDTLGKRGKKR